MQDESRPDAFTTGWSRKFFALRQSLHSDTVRIALCFDIAASKPLSRDRGEQLKTRASPPARLVLKTRMASALLRYRHLRATTLHSVRYEARIADVRTARRCKHTCIRSSSCAPNALRTLRSCARNIACITCATREKQLDETCCNREEDYVMAAARGARSARNVAKRKRKATRTTPRKKSSSARGSTLAARSRVKKAAGKKRGTKSTKSAKKASR